MIQTLISVFVFSMAGVAWGQTTGTISGTVKDETGALLPGVEVTVKSLDTGISRTVVSNDQGSYRASNLNVGNYEISASLAGFQTSVRSGIELTIGREAVVTFTLKVGEITEKVTVTGEAPLVETTSGSLGNLVDRQTVLELPLNGRDLTDLLTLQSGTAFVSTARQDPASGFSPRVSISGARPQDAAIMLDGAGVKGSDQAVPAGMSGNFVGGEGIQEFKIERNSYSAQYGGASGGVVNVVSKAGTNEFHGSLYEFHRNDNLDATNFFSNRSGSEKPPFIRNQFGFSLGGPIIRNKSFFFWNYEGLRDRESTTTFRNLPTGATRQGRLPLDSTGRIRVGAPLSLLPNTVPAVFPYFELWPLPGPLAVDQGNGTAREPVNLPRRTDENYYQIRIDHNFSDSDSLFGRLTLQDSERNRPLEIERWKTRNFVDNGFLALEEKHIFSSQLLNTFRFGYSNRSTGQTAFEDPLSPEILRFVPCKFWQAPLGADCIQGQISIGGVTDVGAGAGSQGAGWVKYETSSYQYVDDVIYNRGAHSLKFGFTWWHIITGGENPSRPAGVYGFTDLVDFLQARSNSFRGAILPGLDSVRELHMNTLGWYIQDDWQITPRLTANLGLRHEFYTVPTEVDGKISNLKSPLTDTEVTILGTRGDSWFKNPSLKSFMPRIGLAWDPTGTGKTAIRLGAGLFYNHIQADTFQRAIFRSAPFSKETNVRTGIVFPNMFDQVVNQGLGSIEMQPFAYDYMKNPHTYQWNLNIQREILSRTAVTVGYAGSRGLNLLHQTNINAAKADHVNGRLVYAPTAQKPNQAPAFRDLLLLSQEASTDSWYHGLQMSLQRRFQAGWQMQVSYTFSRAIDESSQINQVFANQNGGVSYYPEPDLRRSLAAFHVANVFSTSGVWQLPFGKNLRGAAGKLLSGWQLSGILSLADGPAHAITIGAITELSNLGLSLQTPDLVPGASLSPVLGRKDSFHYFDTSGFAFPPPRTLGTVGRNTLIAPGVATLDFSLSKNTYAWEDVNLQFRAEFFNILNRANFSLPSAQVFTSRGAPEPRAGELSSTTTEARQIQFGLRIVF